MTTHPRQPDDAVRTRPAGPAGARRPAPQGPQASQAPPVPWTRRTPDLLARLGIVVPDDARALDAVRRSLLGQPSHPHLQRLGRALSPVGPPHRRVAAVALVAVLATAVALAGSLLAVLGPRSRISTPSALPLATAPVSAPGRVGGLLPDTAVRLDDTLTLDARTLRPAVLLVMPAVTCATCAAA